jgi:hypothetical protein
MWPFLQTTNNDCGCSTNVSYNQCGCNLLSSNLISYNGPELACIDVQLCDTLTDVLQKIDAEICSAGNIFGAGINNYVARWTPNGNTLGTGLIQDNGITTSINTPLDNSWLFKMATSSQRFTQRVENSYVSSIPGNNSISLTAFTNGVNTGGSNIAIVAISSNSVTENTGVSGRAVGSATLNQGGNFEALSGTTNVGSKFYAAGGINNYAIQLQDNTQGTGKFLKSVTIEGHANWADILTSDISNFPSNIVEGSGTLNYVSKWTPDGMTLGNSQIQDSGDCVSVNSFLNFGRRLFVATSAGTPQTAIYGETVTSGQIGVVGSNIGVGPGSNVGVYGDAQGSTDYNYGVSGLGVSNNTATGIGVTGDAYGLGVSIGIRATAISGSQKYAAQLMDGTEGIGKVLTCVGSQGEANWVTPTTGVAGSGTNNFVARWTPDSSTLGAGILQDDGVTLSVNTFPTPDTTLTIKTVGEQYTGIYSINDSIIDGNKTSIYAFTTGTNNSENRGLEAVAQGSTSRNISVFGAASSSALSVAVGATFYAQGLGTNYAIQLQDGTAEVDKVLICMTANGEANWGKVTSNNTTGATGSFTSQDGKTVTVTNGLITSIV